MDANGWMPIELAPEVKGDYMFCLAAWGPEEDQSVGAAFRWNGRWFAAGCFHQTTSDRRFAWRELEIYPTHCMPMPNPPENADGR